MKYVIASDIHGSVDAAEALLNRFKQEKADKLILLGDIYYHGPRNPLPKGYNPAEVARLLNAVKDKLVVIKGNCDSEVDQMISEFKFLPSFVLKVNGLTAIFTHGHKYNMQNCPNRDFDILFCGHEHIGYIKNGNIAQANQISNQTTKRQDGKQENRFFVNPGSISLPKGGTAASYAVLQPDCIILSELNSGAVLDRVNI